MIISDGEGQALASLLEQIPLSLSSDVVEALAVARAISFALEIRCSSFILKGDSEVVIRNLNKDESSLSEIGHILELAKAMTDPNRVSFSHVCQVRNSIARNLAKHARHVSGYLVWMELYS